MRRARATPLLRLGLVLAAALATLQSPPAAAQSRHSDALRAAAAALPRLHSLMVSEAGEVTFEYYARGHGPARHANIKSASKSVLSTLAGIALDRGLIPSLDTPIVRWFPELRQDPDPRKATITVGHLLSMQTGLASTSGGQYGPWVSSGNWVRYALARPMVSAPGTSMEYSTGTSHILSALLTRATGKTTRQFATEALGRPLGFTFAPWTRDPQGIYFGGNEMSMTPRQMVALGELYRRGGRAGDQQVVPAAWVESSCTPRTRSRYDSDREYGYGWWSQDIGGHRACFAWGFGGQYILVFRALDLVVSITSSTTVSDERRGYRRQLFDLLETHILPPPSESLRGARTGVTPGP